VVTGFFIRQVRGFQGFSVSHFYGKEKNEGRGGKVKVKRGCNLFLRGRRQAADLAFSRKEEPRGGLAFLTWQGKLGNVLAWTFF